LMKMDDQHHRQQKDTRARMMTLLGQTNTGVALQLPSVTMPAEVIEGLKPGQIVRLPVHRHMPAILRVSGLQLFDAVPVRRAEYRAAKLIEARAYRNDTGTSPHQN